MAKSKSKTKKLANDVVTVDRRRTDRRNLPNTDAVETKPTVNTKKKTKAKEDATVAKPEPLPVESFERRLKVNRRRQIDPTTCEREYSLEEVEFMQALDLYKRVNGRMFPTCSEVLEVIRSIGYVKVPAGMTIVPLAQAIVGETVLNTTDHNETTFNQTLYTSPIVAEAVTA
jgi:hypothetical protein